MIATDTGISHLAALTEAPTNPPASNDENFSELGNDASEKKSPVGTWELIGTYYGWEDEEELTQPVPLEKLSIWDGERITFTVYGDRIDFSVMCRNGHTKMMNFAVLSRQIIRNWGRCIMWMKTQCIIRCGGI